MKISKPWEEGKEQIFAIYDLLRYMAFTILIEECRNFSGQIYGFFIYEECLFIISLFI